MRGFSSLLLLAALASTGAALPAFADDFHQSDVVHWQAEFNAAADRGRQLWIDGSKVGGTNGVACAQCHPNASNTHPETYPKYQKQLGRVVALWEMVNWCIRNPLQGQSLAADDPRMIALQSYIARERAGVALAPGKH